MPPTLPECAARVKGGWPTRSAGAPATPLGCCGRPLAGDSPHPAHQRHPSRASALLHDPTTTTMRGPPRSRLLAGGHARSSFMRATRDPQRPGLRPIATDDSLRAPHDVAYAAVRALEASHEQHPHRHTRERGLTCANGFPAGTPPSSNTLSPRRRARTPQSPRRARTHCFSWVSELRVSELRQPSSLQKRNSSTCTARNLKCEPKNEQL